MTDNANTIRALFEQILIAADYDENQNPIYARPYVFSHQGAILAVSAENGDSAADYYGEFRGGAPWINGVLVRFAEENGCFWEWINPGAIALYYA